MSYAHCYYYYLDEFPYFIFWPWAHYYYIESIHQPINSNAKMQNGKELYEIVNADLRYQNNNLIKNRVIL